MPAQNRSSHILLKLFVFLAVLAAGAIYAFRSFRHVALVETVVSSDAVDARPGSVTIIPEETLELKSEAAGRILTDGFNLKVGAEVKKGEILAKIDPADLLIEIAKIQNDLDHAKAVLESDHTGEIDLIGMHSQLENYERLNKRGAYSDAELAGYRRAVDQREQQLKLAKINSQYNIDSVQHTLDAAKLKLERMTIHADFDVDVATVATVNKNPGELIGQGDPLASLITKSKRVEGKISEQDSARMAVGDEVTVTFISYGSYEFSGKIAKILATADPLTQRRRVWIDLPEDPKQPFDPGMNGEMSIIVDKHRAKAIVPRRAIFTHNGDAVWVVRDGVVEERKVKRGFVWASGAEIAEGLAAGEQVIVDELEAFKAGEAVTAKVMPGDALRATK